MEWLNPETGTKSAGAAVNGGGTVTFDPPFGNAVLYLRQPGAGTATPQPPFIRVWPVTFSQKSIGNAPVMTWAEALWRRGGHGRGHVRRGGGAPAARFTSRFTQHLASGEELRDCVSPTAGP